MLTKYDAGTRLAAPIFTPSKVVSLQTPSGQFPTRWLFKISCSSSPSFGFGLRSSSMRRNSRFETHNPMHGPTDAHAEIPGRNPCPVLDAPPRGSPYGSRRDRGRLERGVRQNWSDIFAAASLEHQAHLNLIGGMLMKCMLGEPGPRFVPSFLPVIGPPSFGGDSPLRGLQDRIPGLGLELDLIQANRQSHKRMLPVS